MYIHFTLRILLVSFLTSSDFVQPRLLGQTRSNWKFHWKSWIDIDKSKKKNRTRTKNDAHKIIDWNVNGWRMWHNTIRQLSYRIKRENNSWRSLSASSRFLDSAYSLTIQWRFPIRFCRQHFPLQFSLLSTTLQTYVRIAGLHCKETFQLLRVSHWISQNAKIKWDNKKSE